MLVRTNFESTSNDVFKTQKRREEFGKRQLVVVVVCFVNGSTSFLCIAQQASEMSILSIEANLLKNDYDPDDLYILIYVCCCIVWL